MRIDERDRLGIFLLSVRDAAQRADHALGALDVPNAACVVSLADRLMHRAEVVRIEGESYRANEARERRAALARRHSGKAGKETP